MDFKNPVLVEIILEKFPEFLFFLLNAWHCEFFV